MINYGDEVEEADDTARDEAGVVPDDPLGVFLHNGHVEFIFSHSSIQSA